MTEEVLAFAFVISGILIALLAAGIIAFLASAAIWHFFPSCTFARWLKAEIFQECDISQIKIGGCITKKVTTNMD